MRIVNFCAVMLLLATVARADDAAARSADAATIKGLYGEFDLAWNQGNVAALAMVWTDDAQHVEPDGRVVQGRAAIKATFEQRFASDLKGTQSQQTAGDVHFVNPDVAVVDATYEVTGAHDAQGQSLAPIRGRYVDIWIKRKGAWYIAADRPLAAPPAK